jgi:hypothetical protein
MIGTAFRLGLLIFGMSVGAYLGGIPGIFIGLALTDWLHYPVLIYLLRPYDVWLPLLDFVAFGTSIIVIGVAWMLN